MKRVETPKLSEVLKEEFMIPYNLSACSLAKSIGVPVSRIYAILRDKRKISAETSIKLGRFFGISDRYFLRLQKDIDMRDALERINKNGLNIKPISV